MKIKAKVTVVSKRPVVNRYTWNYRKAEKKANRIYCLKLTYTVENVEYVKQIYTPPVPCDTRICGNNKNAAPIRVLKEKPKVFVCAWDVMLKKAKDTRYYAIVGLVLAVAIGVIAFITLRLLCA